MKYLVIILFSCLPVKLLFAQNLLKEKEFINQVITEKGIVYQDSVNTHSASALLNTLMLFKQRVFYSYKPDSAIYIDSTGAQIATSKYKAAQLLAASRKDGWTMSRIMPIAADSLTLSDEEVANIIAQFEKGSKRKWDKDLIAGATQISKDTINAVFAIRSNRGWPYMYSKGIKSIHSFGVPVFIKNDNYCIFLTDMGCGNLCAEGELSIYKKENGKWVFWAIISKWMS